VLHRSVAFVGENDFYHIEVDRRDALQYSYYATTWRYRTKNRRTGSVRVPPVLRAKSGDYMLDAAIDGLGVTLQPRFIAHEAITSGLLESVFSDYE